VGQALIAGKHPDLWENATLVLRNWIGRGPGQDQKVYHNLIELRKYSPAHAATVVSLLHDFGPNELLQPETYDTLIEYLKHERLAIRGLAAWHLYRLVPAGRKIEYNPNGTPAEHEAAYNAWKKLIPNGQLPPKPKAPEKRDQGRSP
jgi:hypothetical protein